MAFKLFKRKPGGTFLGNLVRGAVRTATGGILGNGALKISQEEYDAKNKFQDTQAAKNVQEMAGAAAAGIDANNKANSVLDKMKAGGMKTYAYIAGGVLALGLLVWGVIKMVSPKKAGRR